MYSNYCCSCSFEPEIIKISQSSHKIYSNNIVNFQESTTMLNACTKKSGNLLCVFMDGWLKKGFNLQHLWTVSDCPEDLPLSAYFGAKITQRAVPT